MTTAVPRWIARLRSGCPRGWSVAESRGSIRLVVRSGAGGTGSKASVTLPLEWAADVVPDAIALISDLHQQVEAGHDLRDALQRINGLAPSAKPSSSSQWPLLLERFHDDLKLTSQIKPTTWKDAYAPFLGRAVDLMSTTGAPVNARELVSAAVETWADRPRSRELCVNAVRRFLDFAVEVHGLPAETWTLTDRAAKQLKGRKPARREVATITDVEILRLLDSLPESDACNRWRNAIKLMALYGLRPEELKHLVVREHPDTKQPALVCTYLKATQKSGKPRWLMPLPLNTSTGEVVDWNLAGAMAIGQLPLPSLSDKFAVRTFLERQPCWKELKAKYAATGEWVRAYSFRNAYAFRAHQAGHRLNTICRAMGHSPAVHQSSYEWAKDDSVLEFVD
jgi:integrase